MRDTAPAEFSLCFKLPPCFTIFLFTYILLDSWRVLNFLRFSPASSKKLKCLNLILFFFKCLDCGDPLCRSCPGNICTQCISEPIQYIFNISGLCTYCNITGGQYISGTGDKAICLSRIKQNHSNSDSIWIFFFQSTARVLCRKSFAYPHILPKYEIWSLCLLFF